jgi:hypothetical protein
MSLRNSRQWWTIYNLLNGVKRPRKWTDLPK